ncbi:MAG TPA: hypothetical protein VF540_04530, partial [Segetibacter sp.]
MSDTTMPNIYSKARYPANFYRQKRLLILYLYKNTQLNKLLVLLFFVVGTGSCQTIDIYEKTATFSEHNWKSALRPSFTFEITDT